MEADLSDDLIDTGIFKDIRPTVVLKRLAAVARDMQEQVEDNPSWRPAKLHAPSIDDLLNRAAATAKKSLPADLHRRIEDFESGASSGGGIKAATDYVEAWALGMADVTVADALMCLSCVDRCRTAMDCGNYEAALVEAFRVGEFETKLIAREAQQYALDGKRREAERRKGGKSTGRATPKEKAEIIAARDKLANLHEQTKIWAARKIVAQLTTGTFPGIERRIDLSAKYIAGLRAQR